DRSMTNRAGQAAWSLDDSYPIVDQGQRKVGFRFNAQGAKFFGDLSGNNIGKQLAIILDDKMISAPTLHSRINGQGEISGNTAEGGFSVKEQSYLISMLDAGSLPAQLAQDPISERTVGPQLGQDNLHRGLQACAIGLVVVVIF